MHGRACGAQEHAEVAKATLRQADEKEKAKEDRRAYREKAGKIIVNNRYLKSQSWLM